MEGWGGWEEEEAKVGPEPESDAPTLPLPTGETVEVPPPIDLSSEDEDKAIEEEIVRRTAELPPAVALVIYLVYRSNLLYLHFAVVFFLSYIPYLILVGGCRGRGGW